MSNDRLKNEGLEPTLSNDQLKNEGLEPTLSNDQLKNDGLEPSLLNDRYKNVGRIRHCRFIESFSVDRWPALIVNVCRICQSVTYIRPYVRCVRLSSTSAICIENTFVHTLLQELSPLTITGLGTPRIIISSLVQEMMTTKAC